MCFCPLVVSLTAIVAGSAFAVVTVCPPLEDCLARNALRAGAARLPDTVVRHVVERFEAAQPHATGWERWCLALTAVPTEAVVDEVLALVKAALAHPLSPAQGLSAAQQAVERAITMSDKTHQLDLATRRLLQACMQRILPASRVARAPELNAQRRRLVEHVKQGLLLPEGQWLRSPMDLIS
eukprot:m.102884 g.102884  ORF g.102884 m.102884 type:complete len:182 (-) comp15202_c0_seq8:198-743(-)